MAGMSRAAAAHMASNDKNTTTDRDRADETARAEDGRGVTVESGPEDQLMRFGTATASNPEPLPPDMQREQDINDIDTRAADDAAMEVRRREHSSS